MGRWRAWGRLVLGKPGIIAFFILCALPVGVLTVLVTPPGQSPDEQAHMARAAGLLHGAILGVRKPGIDPRTGAAEMQTGVKVDAGLFHSAFGPVTRLADRPVETARDFSALRGQPAQHERIFVNLPNTATYFPAAYLPATFGLAIGLAVKAPPFLCFLLARLGMLAAYLAAGVAALWLAAFGEALLLTVLLLPMTLFLGSTLNQDGLLTALTCLACALGTRGGRAARWTGLGLFALVLGSKPPYALLMGVFALPVFSSGFWRRAGEVALALVPVVIWVLIIGALVVVPYSKPVYHPGPLYAGDHGVWMDHANAKDNLHILLQQPARFVTLPWHTLEEMGFTILWSMVGVLGPLQLVLPEYYMELWLAALGVAALGLFFTRRPRPVGLVNGLVNLGLVTATICFTYWLIMIMFYLDWSNVGLDWIDGLQGRYSLIFLPFLLFAIPAPNWRFTLPPLLPAIPALCLGLYDLGYIPMKLIWNYFLH